MCELHSRIPNWFLLIGMVRVVPHSVRYRDTEGRHALLHTVTLSPLTVDPG